MKSFYELHMYKIAPIFAEETESFEKPNISQGSSDQGTIRQLNVFSISRASVSVIIKKVSYGITTFSGAQPIKLPTTENKVKELTNKLMGTHELPRCVGTIRDTHIEIVELKMNITWII